MGEFKIFPFSPGIPWELNCGKYIIPNVPEGLLLSALSDKEIIVSAHGGIFETVCSLSALEALNLKMPGSSLFWNGRPEYMPLIKMNGLAQPFEDLSQSTLDNYPVPLFFDNSNKRIFNCLYNYRNVLTYYGTKGYHDKRSAIKQIVENNLFEWSDHHCPKWRNLDCLDDLQTWMRVTKFNINSPFVIIFPEVTKLSQHSNICLDWSNVQIKSIAGMLKQKNIPIVVFTNNPRKYTDQLIHVLPLRLEFIIYMISKSYAILSKEIDFILLGNLCSQAKLIATEQKGEFKLEKNNKFLGNPNVIYTSKTLSPLEAFNIIVSDRL